MSDMNTFFSSIRIYSDALSYLYSFISLFLYYIILLSLVGDFYCIV